MGDLVYQVVAERCKTSTDSVSENDGSFVLCHLSSEEKEGTISVDTAYCLLKSALENNIDSLICGIENAFPYLVDDEIEKAKREVLKFRNAVIEEFDAEALGSMRDPLQREVLLEAMARGAEIARRDMK